MAVKKMPIAAFVEQLEAALNRKDGYIMGATGQDPKKWSTSSWWFTQYSGEQKKKALYWRANAKRVWDCNGLAEGLYKDYSGTDINTRARNNYAEWCGEKGTGLIPTNKRIKGAAVFWGSTASDIHHVAYLDKPVNANKPEGDWYLIEARGVMYGVVQTKLSSRKPNFWGYMTKYFDYSEEKTVKEETKTEIVVPVTVNEEPKGRVILVRNGNYYIRKGAGSKYAAVGIAVKGSEYEYLGKIENGWYNILYKGESLWVTTKCGDIIGKDEESLTMTVKDGSWHVRTNAGIIYKSLGIVHGGDMLPYLNEEKSGWYKVDFNGKEGWISKKAIIA